MTVNTFANIFVPIIRPTLKNANFAPKIFVKPKDTRPNKSNIKVKNQTRVVPDIINALADALSASGHDGDALVAATQDPAVKAQLRANTEQAVAIGACGAPTMVVDGQLFWGNDRINRVLKAALAD